MASRKTPPFPNYPEWTTAKFFAFIRSGLREKFNRWPPKYQVLKQACVPTPILDSEGNPSVFKTGSKVGQQRFINMYRCNYCSNLYKQKEVQVDHIVPAGTLKNFEDISQFAERMFCGTDGLQVLCSSCHNHKTQEEKK